MKGEVIKSIQKHFDYSPAAISVQMKKLIKAGFIDVYKHSTNKEWKYVLRSYRYVWSKLGFRFKDHVERFKFDFVELDGYRDKKSFKAILFTLELKRNKSKQEYKIKQSLDRKINYHSETINTVKSQKVKEKKRNALKHFNSIKTNLEEVNLGGCTKRSMINRISCKRASQVLGYKSAMATTNIVRNASRLQLLSVEKSKTLVATGVPRIEFSINPSYEGHYWIFGRVYKNNCNIYSLHANKRISTLSCSTAQAS